MKKHLMKTSGCSSRPISWCVGAACPLSQSKCFLHEYDNHDGKKMDSTLSRGLLVRSSSYQALHSALARLYRIDDFSLERIGQGFFSEVYKAYHLATGKLMVLKMNKLFSNRHNMLREVELMNRLHHPNILHYYGVCVHEGQVHALTQYIDGGSLDVLLQNQMIELTWFSKISIAFDISKGMAYLHSRKVFHRDLTSKNILIKHTKEKLNGRPKLLAVIADFGLAAPIPHDKNVRLRQVGSPYWMAPEVIRGDWYDQRADAFSFGIITCEIIARCDADPDILPRTHNFGVHYLAFSRMCQSDCPPSFLEIAFQCCQIDPDSRPSFSELENILSYLLSEYRPAKSPRVHKTKVYHRRSLSDESCVLMKKPLTAVEATNTSLDVDDNNTITSRTPEQILERLSAADPYYQASSATVNPFNQVKLPAKSQLIVQEGGRFCHSMPDLRSFYLQTVQQAPNNLQSSSHLTSSDSSLCLDAAGSFSNNSANPTPPDVCINSDCNCSLNQNLKKRFNDKNELDSAKKLGASGFKVIPGIWQQTSSSFMDPGINFSNRGDAPPPMAVYAGASRRRGSGESGFFSVEDIEQQRMGTPELCLSYSELSTTTSVISTEDEEYAAFHVNIQRSPSVVTDSSEDLSSLGCSHDQPCDPSSLPDSSDLLQTNPSTYCSQHLLNNAEGSTDIKSIVEFFERGYGSLRSMSEIERNRKLAVVNSRRKDCLVPLLRNRFNTSSNFRSLAGANLMAVKQVAHSSLKVSSCSKDFGNSFSTSSKPCRGPLVASTSQRCDKKETFRQLGERPKLYITEGTVRAKRNLFESK